MIELAKEIVGAGNHYQAGVAVARKAVELMTEAQADGQLRIAENELGWLEMMTDTLDDLPESEEEFIAQQLAFADPAKFLPAEYGL